MPTALALSPHLDDAAFSCGGTLAALGASGWRVVMLTVFTASVPDPRGFALACQLDKGLSPDIDYMSLRRDEDRVAAARLGIEAPLWLPHPEAPHRGYGSAAELFAGLREDDAVHGAVAEGIVRAAAEVQPSLILAPQGIGGHVDHVQVVHAIRIAALRAPVLWWRDFPYVVRDDAPRQPFRSAMEALPEGAVALSQDARDRKRAACLAYRSQIGFQFGGEDGLDRRLDATGGVELFRVEGEVPWDALEPRP